MFDLETTRFLTDLAAHNARDWFQENRARYDAHVVAPTKAFVDVFSAEMTRRYDTRVEARVFRIHRDVRFSKDKTPYNTHIHISFFIPGAQMSWMVGVQLDRVVLGYGCFGFAKTQLEHWRQTVDGAEGEALGSILDTLTGDGLRIDAPELKRIPAPYAPDHPRGELLRRKSLAVWTPSLPLEIAYGDDAPVRLVDEIAVFDQLQRWGSANL